MIQLPLRAILVGDIVADEGRVIERACVGNFYAPEKVVVLFENGVSFTGQPDYLLWVEEVAFSLMDKNFA